MTDRTLTGGHQSEIERLQAADRALRTCVVCDRMYVTMDLARACCLEAKRASALGFSRYRSHGRRNT